MSTPHANTGAVGIPGLQTGEDVKRSKNVACGCVIRISMRSSLGSA